MTAPQLPSGSAASGAHLSTDLRIACLRIARRNRFESALSVAPHQVAVLVRVEQGATSAREIARWERLSAATVSRTIATLVDLGLVTRSANAADGRRIDLSITDEGRRVLAEAPQAREEWMASRLAQLSSAEVASLERALPALEKIAAL